MKDPVYGNPTVEPAPPCECLRCKCAKSSSAAVTAAPAAGETPPRQDSSPGVGATKPHRKVPVAVKTLAIAIAIAIGLAVAGLCIAIATAKADTTTKDLAVMAAFCHDVRANPTVDGVRHAALEMMQIYSPDKAADLAWEATQSVCPDLRTVVIMAINSPNWTGNGSESVV